MNANEIVAVVLATPGVRSLWGTKRFAVPICGTPTLARVRRVLADAGFRDACLFAGETPCEESSALWTRVVSGGDAHAAASLAEFSGGRPLFVLLGDLPLLTSATVRAFVQAAGSRANRFDEATGAMVVFRTSEAAASVVAEAMEALDASPLVSCGDDGWRAADPDDVRRLVAPSDFSAIYTLARLRKAAALGAGGVLIVDAARTYIDDDVSVGAGTVLLPGTHVLGESRIGAGCSVGPDSWIESSVIEDGAVVRYSVLEGARVRERSTIGPYAHLRHGSDVGPDARVGNFVEVKAARLGPGVKAGHLSYLGDADVGAGTNIGAGTITCNFDGAAKHRTVIEDDVFVGSNASLVAPLRIGRGAVIGAGSTITEDVPPETLAIARARQVIKARNRKPSREDT
ncbi:MAG: NTP transferase domain-containing protein [Candidatus Bipolaricaulota bacterium]|nr:NTP transferase domain-containing protein [Candidatus Bipolaricaulota bacterium]